MAEETRVPDSPKDSAVMRMKPGVTWSGVVTLPTGEPAQNALVFVYARAPLPDQVLAVRGLFRATDRFGRFTLSGLSRGVSLLSLQAFADGAGYSDSRMLDTSELSKPGGSLAIRLMNAPSVSGRVFDAEGKPLAAATVAVSAADGKSYSPTSMTDPSGRYRMPACQPGEYRVIAEKAGRASGFTVISVRDRPLTDVVVKLPKGDYIEGSATGPDGAPIEGLYLAGVRRTAEIDAQGRATPLVESTFYVSSVYVWTDAKGRFKAGPYAAGFEYELNWQKSVWNRSEIGAAAEYKLLQGAVRAKPGDRDVKLTVKESGPGTAVVPPAEKK
jgi:hypothetical protein